MVEALSNLLRVTLNDDSGLIPLEQELSLVQSYIVIQRIRFDETLDYRLAVEADELKDVLIPKLTLQPLIENAIRYGLEQSTQICRVQLSVRRQGAQLVLLVQNDGSLYEDNLLEKLRQKQAALERNSKLLHRRLMKAFPTMKSLRANESLARLREALEKRRNERKGQK